MTSPCRVLIVEDDFTDRELLKESLRKGQSKVTFAEEPTAAGAVQRCREFSPDCILLDLNLPDKNGLDVLADLTRSCGTAPVIVVTAYGSEQVAVAAMKGGATDYIVKTSLTTDNLLHTIEKAIETHRLRAQVARERERYRLLTEAIPQVVWTATHPAGEFDHVSQRWTEATGMPAQSALGKRWLEAVHPQDRDRVERVWREALRTRDRFELECRLGGEMKAYRWHLARAVPQVEADSVLRWFGTFTDVEDRKRAEQALLQRQRLESTGVLAGGVAHDFNNLLTGILGGISYALETLPASHESRPILRNALTASERAALLVRQLLAYAGKGTFMVERVDLTELTILTSNLVRASVPKCIQLNVQAGHPTPPIEADSSQIQQIIMNLIINAAEAIGEDNPGVITVRTEEEWIGGPDSVEDLAPGVYAVLEVVDTGCGMTEDVQARIFEPFFTTKFTGRGLGLAAVMGIVRSAKGAIRVRSAPGEGTSFRVLLPARGDPSVASRNAPAGSAAVAGTVLIVDDEEIVRETASTILRRGGYSVTLARDGMEAIEQVRANPALFDLVLLDLNMPGPTGEETLRQLRAIRPSMPVLAFTGFSESEVASRLGGQAFAGVLHKPFTSRILLEHVARFFATRPDYV